jgi:hypothetical protein
MAEIPVFNMIDARKLKKGLALPSNLDKDDPSVNHALMLVAKTTVEHIQGVTADVILMYGPKGTESGQIRIAKAFNRKSGSIPPNTLVIVTNVNTGLEIVEGVGTRRQAILLEDLAAAVNTKRDPSTAMAMLLKKNSSGDLISSGVKVEVVNRFKYISIDATTYIKIEMMDDEWQLYAADCPGGSGSTEESL